MVLYMVLLFILISFISILIFICFKTHIYKKLFISKMFLIIIATLSIFIIYILMTTPKYDYDIGRDCYEAFGNAEYQLLISSYNNERYLSLHNSKYKCTVINNITTYKKAKNKVYLFSSDGIYAVLILNTNILYYFQKSGEVWFSKINTMIEEKNFIRLKEFNMFDDEDQRKLLLLRNTFHKNTRGRSPCVSQMI